MQNLKPFFFWLPIFLLNYNVPSSFTVVGLCRIHLRSTQQLISFQRLVLFFRRVRGYLVQRIDTYFLYLPPNRKISQDPLVEDWVWLLLRVGPPIFNCRLSGRQSPFWWIFCSRCKSAFNTVVVGICGKYVFQFFGFGAMVAYAVHATFKFQAIQNGEPAQGDRLIIDS